MSDFTAKLDMLKDSMRTVTPGGSRGVRFRLDELNELLEHRRQIDRLVTKAGTDTERTKVEALLSEAGDRIEVSRRRLDARRKGLERRRGKVAESQARSLAEAKAAWFRAVGRLTVSWSEQRQREKHVESVVVGRSEASGRPLPARGGHGSKRKRMQLLMRPYVLTEPGRLALRRTIRRTRPWRWTRGPVTPAGKRRSAMNALRHGRRRASVIQRTGNQAAVLDALHAHIDFDETTPQQPRTAFKALRRIARAAEQALKHGDPDEFARPVLDCLRPLIDMGPEVRPTRAEIDAVINRPGAMRLWNRATWQLIVGLIRQMGSNIDATGVILRIDAINRRAELAVPLNPCR